MERKQIERLLAALPHSEDDLLRTVQSLEHQKLAETAQDLLARALDRGAGERTRLELSLRLIERGQPTTALRHLDALPSPRHPVDFALLRGVANHSLLRFNDADDEFQKATALGLPNELLEQWRAYLYDEGPPPPLPYRSASPANPTHFAEPEPTHLIDLNNPSTWESKPHRPSPHLDDSAAETILRPSLRLPDTALPQDETFVQPRPALSQEDIAIANEQTAITTVPERSIALDPLFKDPTLPDTVERAAEMPRYITHHSGTTPSQPDESSPFIHDALAAMPFDEADDERFAPHKSLELDLELDHDPAPGTTTPPPDRAQPQSEDSSSAPGSAYGPVRQFTNFMRDQAPAQFTVILQSPARALSIAAITALLVLFSGTLIIYSTIGNSRLRAELNAAQIAIDADLYSSHLAAIRDLNRLAEFQVISNDTIDKPLRSLTTKVPLLGFDDKLTRARDLALFTRARQSYRFEHPGSMTLDELPEPTTPLIAAAHAYLHLASQNLEQAQRIADNTLTPHSQDPNIALAITDIIVAGDDQDLLKNFAERAPDSTAATAFLRAQALLVLQDDRAQEIARSYITDSFPDHVGLQLLHAALSEDRAEAEQILATITDPSHPHASRIERAQAYLQRAALKAQKESSQATLRDLEQAAQTAPLHPEAVRPLIDELLRRGEVLQARAHLSRLPQTPGRHPYFDLAIARIDHLVGDRERAQRRLQPHAKTIPEAAARLATIYALDNEPKKAQELFDDTDKSPSAKIIHAWLATIQGIDEDDAHRLKALDDLDQTELSPTLRALKSETYRRAASQATSRKERQDLLQHAADTLGPDAADNPETRAQTCLIALDRRSQSDSEQACQLLADRDIAAQLATQALIRWHLYERRDDQALAALKDHITRAGPSATTRILEAHQHILRGELEEARQTLDALPAADQRLPQRHIAEGALAMHTGHFAAAALSYQSAIDTSKTRQPEALIGLASAKIHLDDITPELEDALRSALRDGEFGPQAWTTFATLRRHQNRIADARENIAFANQAMADFGSTHEEILILTERLAQEQRRRGPGHRALLPLLSQLEDLGADHWHFHQLAARWHQAQRRPDRERLNHHLQRSQPPL